MSFSTATQLSGDDWTQRDLVQVGDLRGGAALDLVFRTDTTGRSGFVYRLLADKSFEGFSGFGATEESSYFTPHS